MKVDQKRDAQGRYDYEKDWDRLCVCGHTLGVHAAEGSECFLYSFSPTSTERVEHAHQPDANCRCEKFRPKRSKGKFTYQMANAKATGEALLAYAREIECEVFDDSIGTTPEQAKLLDAKWKELTRG